MEGFVFFSPLQVFDHDFALHDDFMGSAFLYLESLEQQRYVSLMIFMPPFGTISVPLPFYKQNHSFPFHDFAVASS